MLSSLCSSRAQGCCAGRGILQLLSPCPYQPAFLQRQHPPALDCITDCLGKNKPGFVKLWPLLCSLYWADGAGRDASLLPPSVTWENHLSGSQQWHAGRVRTRVTDEQDPSQWVKGGSQEPLTTQERVRQKAVTHLRNLGPDWSNI